MIRPPVTRLDVGQLSDWGKSSVARLVQEKSIRSSPCLGGYQNPASCCRSSRKLETDARPRPSGRLLAGWRAPRGWCRRPRPEPSETTWALLAAGISSGGAPAAAGWHPAGPIQGRGRDDDRGLRQTAIKSYAA